MRHLKRFTHANILVSILFLLVFAYLSYDRFHAAELRENNADLDRCLLTFTELLSHKGEGFSIKDGKLLAGSYVINGNFEVPDKIREIFGGTATIFMGDRRVATNVLQADGRRAIGTRLEGPAYDAVFRQGKAFRGETQILGIPYFTAYDPIRDSNGKIIGALYVGLKKSEFLAHHTLVKTQIILILSGLSAVFITFMILFSRLVKKAESTIEAEHQFLQTLIDAIPTPVFYKNVNRRYLGGNKAFEAYTGMPTAQLIGKTAFDLLTPDLAIHVDNDEQELLQKKGLLVKEAAMPYADGTLREVIYLKTTFPAADGSLGGLIGTMLDISDRKRAEEELRESRQHLSDIIQFYPDATLVIDSKGKVTAWNRAMEALTGVQATEMIGKGNYEYALPFYGERRPLLIDLAFLPINEIEKKYIQLERNGDTLTGEAYIHNARGENLYFHGTAAPLRNFQGEVIGAIESIRDISGRKQMEDQLRVLSCGVEQSPASIVFTDRDGSIEYVNPKFTQLTGYTAAEAIGQNPRILKSGLTPPEVHRQLWETILAGGEWHGEFCNRKKNGDLYWESASISPVADAGGNITRFIAVKEDITEQKKAANILAEKERIISGILDGIQDGICMLDEELRIVRVNPFFEQYYAKRVPFLGKKCHEVFWSSSEPCEDCPSIRTLQSGERASKIFSINQAGEVAWFELVTFPLLDPDKSRVTGVVEYLSEITGRKRMEERAAYLASFPELNPNPILEVNSAGEVIFFNPAAQNILDTLGVEREDFTVFFPADMHQILEDLGKQEELTFCRELRIQDRVFFEDIYIAPKFFAGARFFIRDISDRILVEEEVIALNAELERKVDSKTRQLLEAQEELVRKEKLSILGQLSGSVGHELRNPLGVMSNAVYFLKMVLTEADDTTKEYLDIIKNEIDNSQRIISDLLDFARTRTPQIRPTSVRELLNSSIGKCIIPDTVNLQTEIQNSLPLLKIDPLQMEQVFQNLTTNAVQAMPIGGTLRIAANSKLDSDFIEISVTDTGEGISPENMKKLFQPLFTTKTKGIGLGLVVCRNLVEANGCEIKVESELGKGTTFMVTLPV